jgi:hypothetical protein
LPEYEISENDVPEYLCRCNDIVEGWYHILWFIDGAWIDSRTGEEVPFIVEAWKPIKGPSE